MMRMMKEASFDPWNCFVAPFFRPMSDAAAETRVRRRPSDEREERGGDAVGVETLREVGGQRVTPLTR